MHKEQQRNENLLPPSKELAHGHRVIHEFRA